jgi:hypothetical protein
MIMIIVEYCEKKPLNYIVSDAVSKAKLLSFSRPFPEAEFLDVIGAKVKVVWKWFYNIHIVHGNLKSENSQDYAQKPQQNCTFRNLASGKIFIDGCTFFIGG